MAERGAPRACASAAGARSLVTRIHGRYYDLGGFSHPGGCPALECARDRDATALFESYHALHRDLPAKVLRRYELGAEEAAAAGRRIDGEQASVAAVDEVAAVAATADVDWIETLASPFRADLIACARRYFEEEQRRRGLRRLGEATRAPLRRWLEVASIGALFCASLVALLRGSWPALLAAPALGWLFLVNFWHDALHFAMSPSWRLNAALPYLFPWFISPKLWMHQHVIGHHVSPNHPLRDPDVRAALPVLRQTPGLPWGPRHAAQRHLPWLLLLYALALPVRNALRDHVTRWLGSLNETVPLVLGPPWRRALHVAGRLLVAASLFVWPFLAFPLGKALCFALVPSLLLSLLFAIFTQGNHITEPAAAAGCAPPADWYEAQARASCSYAPDSYLSFLLSGGLNLQIEHHLLPGVNHYHLFRLSPQLRALCDRHGVPYQRYPSLLGALRAHLAYMRRLGEPPGNGSTTAGPGDRRR